MSQKFCRSKAENAEIDLHLAVMDAVRAPHETFTQQEIADVCGLHRGGVWTVENRAMKKIRQWLYRNGYKQEAFTLSKPGARPRTR